MANPHTDRALAALTILNQTMQLPAAEAHQELYRVERQVVAWRDGLIADLRAGEDVAEPLRQANAILSLIVGCEYPVGGIQWKLLEQAREALHALTT